MTQHHFLDIKIPLGWLLTFYGVVLASYGFVSKPELYEKSLHVNINLIWGIAMLVIGVLLLLLSCHTHSKRKRTHIHHHT